MMEDSWKRRVMQFMFNTDVVVHTHIVEWASRTGSSIEMALDDPDASEVKELLEVVGLKATEMSALIRSHSRGCDDQSPGFQLAADSIARLTEETMRLLQKMYPAPPGRPSR
jgi:hypothetical protein